MHMNGKQHIEMNIIIVFFELHLFPKYITYNSYFINQVYCYL